MKITAVESIQLAEFPNTLVQEVVRAFYHGWYGDIVTQLPSLKNGRISAPCWPGLGTALRLEIKRRNDATVRVSRL
ncbi:MAG: hypothetical protein EXR39_00665 [Betaproteobacteria bacterium]|nr:hypothetical protein [Betaproteobacteria bacterium]